MNFEDEPYVRLYKRRTLTIKLLGWEGRLVFWALLLEVDRAGVLDLGSSSPAEAIAALSDIPIEVAEIGMARALKQGVVEQRGDALFVPRFMEAQEAKQSDKARQRESRGRRAALMRCSEGAIRAAATDGDSPLSVTNRDHIQSQNVTDCHDRSHAVTRGHSELSSAQLSSAQQGSDQGSRATPAPEPETMPPVASPRAATAKKSRSVDSIPVPMSDEVIIPDDVVAAKAAQWQVDEARIRAQVPEFKRFWAQDRPGERRSPKGWRSAFGRRVDDLGKRGLLHAPIQQALGVVTTRATRAADLLPRQMERIRQFEAEEEAERKGEVYARPVLLGGSR